MPKPEFLSDWLNAAKERSSLKIQRIPLSECDGWYMKHGRLVHRTGGFFSVCGVKLKAGQKHPWFTQSSYLDQPEIGLLGFIIRRRQTGVDWLLQAKTEPGNVRETQIAPSVQATFSNAHKLHGGQPTRFLELFDDKNLLLSDGAHSEQGSRFLQKFNRNSIRALEVDQHLHLRDNWCWASSDHVREALGKPYTMNTDARSVIASGPWWLLSEGRVLFNSPPLLSSYAIRPNWRIVPYAQGAFGNSPKFEVVGLDALPDHALDDDGLRSKHGDVIAAYDVRIAGREVDHWRQPFLLDSRPVKAGIYTRLKDDRLQVFISPFKEVGFGGRTEFGPSWQSGYPKKATVKSIEQHSVWREVIALDQSDEGGRFMKTKARYIIRFVEDGPTNSPQDGSWVDLSTLEMLCQRSGVTTNELRTIVSLLLSRQADDAFCSLLGT